MEGGDLCVGPDGLLYVFGGTKSFKMYIYNVDTKEWKQGASMPDFRAYFGCVCTEKQIIIAGGYANNKYYNDILMYDFETQKWMISNNKLSKSIGYFSMTINNNYEIHSFGGWETSYINYHFIIKQI